MSTLQTKYQNYLKENPESTFNFEEWSHWKFSNIELPPPHVLQKEPPYISDDFQIGPDGAYEHIQYSIPIYEDGIKTKWTVDGHNLLMLGEKLSEMSDNVSAIWGKYVYSARYNDILKFGEEENSYLDECFTIIGQHN